MAGFNVTEATLREVLLEELRNSGVRLSPELSARVPSGRRGPDAVLVDGGEYVLETKVGEANYYDDILKLAEWIKWEHLPIRGAFAVLIPQELRRLPWDPETLRELAKSHELKYEVSGLFKDDRHPDRRAGTLQEIVGWIARHVLEPPREIEPDVSFVVKILAGAVERFDASMRRLKETDLDDIFGGKTVFDNILQYEEGRYPLEEMRRAASYLLINQLIFYGVLSRVDSDTYPPIDPDSLGRPGDLRIFFDKVLEVDYAATFGFDIASRLPPLAIDTLRGVIRVIRSLGLERLKHDVLGRVFHNLIPLEVRKPVAAFYTNDKAAELLARMAVDNGQDLVLDPAVGSGTLLVAGYKAKQEHLESGRESFGREDHMRMVGRELTGIDIMPFAAHLAVVHLSLQAPEYLTDQVRIAVFDSTELEPENAIPPITQELKRAFQRPTLDMYQEGGHPTDVAQYVSKGALTADGLGGQSIQLEPVDVVIMNPPFTRCDRMLSEYRDALRRRFDSPSEVSKALGGKLGLQAYFILLAHRFLRKDGRIAAVLPQTTLTGESYGPIISMLTEQYTIRAIVVGLGRSAFSENTALSEILLIAEKNPPPDSHRFALIGSRTSPTKWTSAFTERVASLVHSKEDFEDETVVIRWIPQSELASETGGLTGVLPHLIEGYEKVRDSLAPLFTLPIMTTYREYEERSGVQASLSPLGNREVPGPKGRGGVYFGTSALNICRDESKALKKVDRLVLINRASEKFEIVDRVTGATFEMERAAVAPNVRRLSQHPSFDISDSTDYVISGPGRVLPDIMRTIYGEGEAETYLRRVEERWPERVEQGSTHLSLARRIDIAAPGTHHIALFTETPSFTGHGGWGFRNINKDDAKLLTLWFNSSLFLYQLMEWRTQTRGTWWRLDKHRYGGTKIPDFLDLDEADKEWLLGTFERLRAKQYPSLIEQLKESNEYRREIDMAWLRVLGVNDDERDELVSQLHSYLFRSIEQLKSAMEQD